jgi:hypothetical protein
MFIVEVPAPKVNAGRRAAAVKNEDEIGTSSIGFDGSGSRVLN